MVNLDCRQDGSVLDPKWNRAAYLMNSTNAGINRRTRAMLASVCGCGNPRNFPIDLIGCKVSPTRTSISALTPRWSRTSAATASAETMRKGERPLIIIGADLLARMARLSPRSRPRPRCRQGRLGTATAFCRMRLRAWVRSISDFVPGEGGLTPCRWRRPARWIFCRVIFNITTLGDEQMRSPNGLTTTYASEELRSPIYNEAEWRALPQSSEMASSGLRVVASRWCAEIGRAHV